MESGCRSAGSDLRPPLAAGRLALALLVLALGARATAAAATGAEAEEAPGAARRAEIVIELPPGDQAVAVEPRQLGVVLELPADARLPADFVAASGGLLRGADVQPVEGRRVRVELELAQGLLDRFETRDGSLRLVLSSRFVEVASSDVRQQYLIGASDRLLLTVHNQPDLTTELTVTREGLIIAPLVGDVQAEGLTPRQLAGKLTELYGRDYLVDPRIDVDVVEYRSQWVIVSGQIERPGRVPLRGGTRLKEVLGESGGLNEDAGEVIRITRRVEGSDESTSFVVKRADFENGLVNPVLAEGDIVEVERAKLAFIQGEVREPRPVIIDREMTLLRAITLAGGTTDWADLKNVKVLYQDGAGPAERTFNLKAIRRGKAEDPKLAGGEMVIIGRRFL